ncbi:Alkaline/neutral invertase [Heracleum sosnowskyi]|uniref:Alkaline/neutral invertase n=1 Tax=Heracleum sosnowskyi TaxID=360622 RepID=A0AAD8MDC4_9APIA|nr:Alkaline/neutral invertase [Heracleum sosnowskyi]
MPTHSVDVTPSESVEDPETSCIVPKTEFDISKLPERPIHLSTDRDMVRAHSLSAAAFADLGCLSPQMSSRTGNISKLDHSDGGLPPVPVNMSDPDTTSSAVGHETSPMMSEAWEALKRAKLHFRGEAVGTLAAMDSSEEKLNYDQVFVRDFVPSALAFLMHNEPDIVKNFLLKTLRLQSSEKRIDRFQLGEGVMPASFKVIHDPLRNSETLTADFGESAIGRVAPIDSGFWWIILLRAYTKSTGDNSLADMPECQKGMRLILSLCLSEGFDTFPTLLCADGCCMIDRRMGVYGYPIEIQALFFMALRCAHVLLKRDAEGKECVHRIEKRLIALKYHMREYFWLDFKQLNDIYRYKTEEYSHTAVNKFNVIPDSLPDWIFDFMPTRGGYFIGNVGPSKMDFRWFCLGNCVAILASLASPIQSNAIMDLIEARWEELVGEMPLKACYPAIEGHEWKILTGCDPKNTRWSYHNGGSWPVLIWLLTAACIKTKRHHIAEKAIKLIEERLSRDGWPEYYDGKTGRYIGKQARKKQTWSIAGYLVAKKLLEDDSNLSMIALEGDIPMESTMKRSTSCSSFFSASRSKNLLGF